MSLTPTTVSFDKIIGGPCKFKPIVFKGSLPRWNPCEASHGFHLGSDPLNTIGLNLQGPPIILSNDTVVGVSDKDVKSYKSYLEDLKRFAKMLKPFWHKKMPRIGRNSISDVITFGHLGVRKL